MTNEDLASSYLHKSIVRRKALQIYMDDQSYSDVVRERAIAAADAALNLAKSVIKTEE